MVKLTMVSKELKATLSSEERFANAASVSALTGLLMVYSSRTSCWSMITSKASMEILTDWRGGGEGGGERGEGGRGGGEGGRGEVFLILTTIIYRCRHTPTCKL